MAAALTIEIQGKVHAGSAAARALESLDGPHED